MIVWNSIEEREQIRQLDYKVAKDKGMMVVGFARLCQCGGRAYHSPTANWVVCLTCNKKWSE